MIPIIPSYSDFSVRWTDLLYHISPNFSSGKQVLPFKINTTDGENLYAWHILPLATYARNEEALLDEKFESSHDVSQNLAIKFLSTDQESRLVINCSQAPSFKK